MASASASLTRQVVRAYHDAWTGPNVARAGDYIAQDFKTRASVGSYDSRTEYLAGLSNFRTNFVTRVDLLSELYGDGEAMLLYDVHTNTPAGTIRTAEHFRLSGMSGRTGGSSIGQSRASTLGCGQAPRRRASSWPLCGNRPQASFSRGSVRKLSASFWSA